MILETQRLIVRALNPGELVKYSALEAPFEDRNIEFAPNEIDDALRPVLFDSVIPNVMNNEKDYLFYTLWLLVEKKFNSTIGTIMFKGKPDKNGKAEIGYGTHEEFRDKGYMGEAVEAVCRWAFETGIVKYIVAETAKDNHASFSLLKKNGFIKYDENDGFFYWMKTRNA